MVPLQVCRVKIYPNKVHKLTPGADILEECTGKCRCGGKRALLLDATHLHTRMAEAGYYLTENASLGLFMAYHSNHEYVGRETLAVGNGASLTTDQQHTLFQMPFGVAGRYTFMRESTFQPYVSLKVGPQFARLTSDFSAYQSRDNTWGFYFSPEIGMNIYPWVYGPGIHVAAYYSYGTNKGDVLTYSVSGLSNFGLRIGVAF